MNNYKFFKKGYIILILISLLSFPYKLLASPPRIGYVEGKIEILENNKESWFYGAPNYKINDKSRIRTLRESRAILILGENLKLQMDPLSCIKIFKLNSKIFYFKIIFGTVAIYQNSKKIQAPSQFKIDYNIGKLVTKNPIFIAIKVAFSGKTIIKTLKTNAKIWVNDDVEDILFLKSGQMVEITEDRKINNPKRFILKEEALKWKFLVQYGELDDKNAKKQIKNLTRLPSIPKKKKSRVKRLDFSKIITEGDYLAIAEKLKEMYKDLNTLHNRVVNFNKKTEYLYNHNNKQIKLNKFYDLSDVRKVLKNAKTIQGIYKTLNKELNDIKWKYKRYYKGFM